MPLCWIFLLKRRRALSNVSFSPTRTSANPGSPPQAQGRDRAVGLAASRSTRSSDGGPIRGWRSIAEGPGRVKRAWTRRSGGRPSRRRRPAGSISRMETLLDLLDHAVAAYSSRTALSLRLDDGTTTTWSYRELDRRSRIAAWRLRALGLERGDRLLTWSPSTPALPAVYFGAMRAGLILVPLDLRMSADAVENVVEVSGARHLVLGTGRDAPDPRDAGLERFPTTPVDRLVDEPDATFPVDWEAQLDAWPAPATRDVFELVFTSGTTGTPKGVMLAHDNVVAAVESFHRLIPPMEHRIV